MDRDLSAELATTSGQALLSMVLIETLFEELIGAGILKKARMLEVIDRWIRVYSANTDQAPLHPVSMMVFLDQLRELRASCEAIST